MQELENLRPNWHISNDDRLLRRVHSGITLLPGPRADFEKGA